MVGIQTTSAGWVVVLVLTSRLSFPSLVAQMVNNLSAMQETQVLGGEDPLEKEMATHSSILAWRIPWIEESGGLQPMGSQRVRHDSTTDTDVYMPIYRLFQFVPPQQENSRKTSTTASLTMLNPLTVWITTNCGKFLKISKY